MKLKFAPTLIAGAFALAAAGCMTERTPGSANESAGPMGQSNYCATHATEARCAGGRDAMATDPYGRTDRDVMGDRYSTGTDPYARGRYQPFPAMDNESAGPIGMSMWCRQHYNQPGCGTNSWDSNSNYSRGTTSR